MIGADPMADRLRRLRRRDGSRGVGRAPRRTSHRPAWAQGVVDVMGASSPQAVLAAGSDRGNEVMAHVAAKTELPLAANCIEVEPG